MPLLQGENCHSHQDSNYHSLCVKPCAVPLSEELTINPLEAGAKHICLNVILNNSFDFMQPLL